MINSGRLVLASSSLVLLIAFFVYCIGLAGKPFKETSERVSFPIGRVGSGTPTPTPSPIPGAQFYVSPTGLLTGNGSITRPWDLRTALGQPNAVKPGATIYLRGGTYSGKFTSSLTGTPANPITVRSYPGEWAKIDGYVTTTLVNSIDATANTITVADASKVPVIPAITFQDQPGTYNSSSPSVSIPMTGLTAAQPVGSSFAARTHTAPEFGVFVLIKTSN